jgi:hypothetical protein
MNQVIYMRIIIIIISTLIIGSVLTTELMINIIMSGIGLLVLAISSYFRFRDAGKSKTLSIITCLFAWTCFVPVWGAIIPSKK